MKKRSIGVLILIAILFLTCACDNGEEKENKDDNNNKIQEAFVLKYDNITFELGGEFTTSKYGEELDYSETKSCAFEGLDKTYMYEHYEIATYPDGNKDRISSIYFLDPDITTTEGVAIADSKDKMLEVYGKNYKEDDGEYTYTKGKTQLIFLVQDDSIVSIEYVYVTE